MKCKLITTVSDPTHPGWLTLKYSLEKFGWDYEICGTEYHQFGSKMVNAYNYANTTDCTHLFIVDAYDVVVLGTMEEAVRKIDNMDVCLFNSERNCWPYEQWKILYDYIDRGVYGRSKFPYLNGGMAFVSVERFIKLFEASDITHESNDQVNLSAVYLTSRDKFNLQLDKGGRIFQTLCGTTWDEFEFNGGRLNTKWQTPILIHGNGRAPMDRIIELL